MSTPLAVSCPNCGAGLKLKSKTFVGKKVPCPKCKQPFVVEEPPEDEFLEDDFGGGDDYQEEEEEEEPRPKKSSKGGKGKKKSKSGGGSGIVLMIGGGILGVALLVGVVYGAMSLLSGMGGSSGWTAWMPEDTDMVIRLKPSDLTNSQFLKPVMEHPTLSKLASMPPAQAGGGNELVTALNLTVKDIDTITIGGKSFAMSQPAGNRSEDFIAVVRTKVSVDSAKLDQAATVVTKETYNDKTVYSVINSNPKMLVHMPAPDTFVFGTDAQVRAAIDRKGAGAGSRFVLSDSNAQIYVCLAPKDPSALSDGPQNGSPFASGFQFGNRTKEARMSSVTFGINCSSDAAVTMTMNSLDRFDTKVQTDLMKADIEKAKTAMGASGGGFFDPAAGLKAHVKTMLDGATVDVSGKTCTVKMTLPGKIVSDGLALAAPFMPMLEQQLAAQQKMAAAATPTASSASPVGITDYPGAVINAGNNAQNRINNLGDQHNADIAAQMQEGAGGAHGAPAGAAPAAPAANDPAAAMRLQQGGAHGAPAGAAPAAPAANDPAAAMRLQQGGAHGAPAGAAPAAPAANDPAAAMRLQQGGAHAAPAGAAPAAPAANDPAAAMRLQQGGAHAAPPGAAPAANDPAAAMRLQQGAPAPAGGEGQPAAEGQNGNETKPAPRSRSRRRSS
jgi:hypothetical protein